MSDTCTKVIIVILNLAFLAFGVCILALGIVFKTSFDKLKDAFMEEDGKDLKGDGETLGLACIILGSFITVLSFCGCIGACCRAKFFLAIYGVCITIMLIAQIACVIVLSTGAFDIDDKVVTVLKKSVTKLDENNVDDRFAGWGVFFKTFECCGVTSNYTSEFQPFTAFKKRPTSEVIQIPVSCCKSYNEDDKIDLTMFNKKDIKTCLETEKNDKVWKEGCYDKLVNWVNDHKPVVIGVGVGVMVVELILIAMAFFLCSRDDEE